MPKQAVVIHLIRDGSLLGGDQGSGLFFGLPVMQSCISNREGDRRAKSGGGGGQLGQLVCVLLSNTRYCNGEIGCTFNSFVGRGGRKRHTGYPYGEK